MEYIKGETITLKKIVCNNCNFESSECSVEVCNVSHLDNLSKLDEIKADKKDGYFYAQIQTEKYDIAKSLCLIVTVSDNSNNYISKKKMYFKEV